MPEDGFNATLNFSSSAGHSERDIAAALAEMEKDILAIATDLDDDAGEKVTQGGLIIEARAKEIITEKGHVVTGALRRSINTQPRQLSEHRFGAAVGSPMEYAPDIEVLPDGGYLNEAAEQRFEEVTQFLVDEWIDPSVEEWRRAGH